MIFLSPRWLATAALDYAYAIFRFFAFLLMFQQNIFFASRLLRHTDRCYCRHAADGALLLFAMMPLLLFFYATASRQRCCHEPLRLLLQRARRAYMMLRHVFFATPFHMLMRYVYVVATLLASFAFFSLIIFRR